MSIHRPKRKRWRASHARYERRSAARSKELWSEIVRLSESLERSRIADKMADIFTYKTDGNYPKDMCATLIRFSP